MIQENNQYSLLFVPEEIYPSKSDSIVNYSEVLGQYEIEFKRIDNYLAVGNIDWVQGWILDIGVVCTQIVPLLQKILPLLSQEEVPFRLVRNLERARSILGGGAGFVELGKIISIYPPDEHDALELALQLIPLTSAFKGPEIPTDRHLGSVIYTRFGACSPIIRIDHQNMEVNCIYDPAGNLIKEPLSIPFDLPQGIQWPFGRIVSSRPSKKDSVLQDRYKPMAVLKEDAKGSVRKGLMLEKFYKIKWCVIKEGRRGMASDEFGRDIHDRLQWQFEIQKDMEGCIPAPKVYDLFEENGNTYLVMEFIQGVPLFSAVTDVFKGRKWPDISLREKMLLLDFCEQILKIIGAMHEKGYIHRDIMPNNFLVTPQQQFWLIDLELTYSEKLSRPFPPFRLGTPGFMSPEQQAGALPNKTQDVYALGANLMLILTGLYPNGFTMIDREILKKQIIFFIQDEPFADMIANCFSYDPDSRPTLTTLKTSLNDYRNRVSRSEVSQSTATVQKEKPQELKHTINFALQGLSNTLFTNANNLWRTKKGEDEPLAYGHSRATVIYNGFSRGLSGILYVLSKARQAGFSIVSCMENYATNLAYIRQLSSNQLSEAPGGLYTGTAGIAIALVEGLKAGLISTTQEVKKEILQYLKNSNLTGCDIANGLAGKGLTLLRACEVIDDSSLMSLLKTILDDLLDRQQQDGSWLSNIGPGIKKTIKLIGWGHGAAGIAFFLLEYVKRSKDAKVKLAATRAVHWVIQQSRHKNGQRHWPIYKVGKEIDRGTLNGLPGIILCLIKAYEVIGDPYFKQIAEDGLKMISKDCITTDLTLESGVVGIGELYLEAARAFKSDEWFSRANQITEFLLHYFVLQNDGSRYWLTKENDSPTPDLLLGNSGIIHFLLRNSLSNSLNHPLTIV